MPLPLLAVGMLALPFLGDLGKGVKGNDATLLIGGLGALWLFNQVKGPLDTFKDFQEKLDPVPEIEEFWKGATEGRDTGTYVPGQYERGLSPNPPTESWAESFGDEEFLYDVPIAVQDGLGVPSAYVRTNPPPTTTAEEFGIWTGQVYSMLDPENPYEVDLPGIEPYDVRNIPGDIGGGIQKLWQW